MILKSSLSQSILNAYIQQSVDAEGNVDRSKMPDVLKSDAQISGIDRANAQSDTSEWLELVITKEKCSIAEAYAILNLTLVGEVNSTTGQLGYINEYDSVHRSAPELMNLAGDILQLIPLKDLNLRNDNTGSKPKEFDEWVKEIVESFVRFLTDLIVAIGNVIANVVEQAVKVGLKVVEVIREAAMAVLEAMMKAALLAFIYGLLAITLNGLILQYLILYSLLAPLILPSGGSIEIDSYSLDLSHNGLNINFYSKIDWKFNGNFDLKVPYVIESTYVNNVKFSKTYRSIITDEGNQEESDYENIEIEPSSEEDHKFKKYFEEEIVLETYYKSERGTTDDKFTFYLRYKSNENIMPSDIEFKIFGAKVDPGEIEIKEEDENDLNCTDGKIYYVEYDDFNEPIEAEFQFTVELERLGVDYYNLTSKKHDFYVGLSLEKQLALIHGGAMAVLTLATALIAALVAVEKRPTAPYIISVMGLIGIIGLPLLFYSAEFKTLALGQGLIIGSFLVFLILALCGAFHYTKKVLSSKEWFPSIEPILALINTMIGFFGVAIALWPDSDTVDLALNAPLFYISLITFIVAAVAGSTEVLQSKDARSAHIAYWIITALFLGAFFYYMIIIPKFIGERGMF